MRYAFLALALVSCINNATIDAPIDERAHDLIVASLCAAASDCSARSGYPWAHPAMEWCLETGWAAYEPLWPVTMPEAMACADAIMSSFACDGVNPVYPDDCVF